MATRSIIRCLYAHMRNNSSLDALRGNRLYYVNADSSPDPNKPYQVFRRSGEDAEKFMRGVSRLHRLDIVVDSCAKFGHDAEDIDLATKNVMIETRGLIGSLPHQFEIRRISWNGDPAQKENFDGRTTGIVTVRSRYTVHYFGDGVIYD